VAEAWFATGYDAAAPNGVRYQGESVTPEQVATNRSNAAIALSALIIIGTIGPWATIFTFSVSGTDTDDGKLVLGMGIVALVIGVLARLGRIGRKAGRIVLGIIGALVALISIYDASVLSGTGVSLGWGIIVDIIAGFGLLAVVLVPLGKKSPAGTMPTNPITPASWQPDPTGRHEYRYWDGAAYTDQVADAGVAGVDPLGQ
jgi:hypothetical protein